MNSFRIVVTEHLESEALLRLKAHIHFQVDAIGYDQLSETQHELILKNADALLIRSRTKIDSKLLQRMPNLKCIVSATSGFDHIDFKSTQNIKVMHTPLANAASAAECTWTLVLACARNIIQAHKQVKSGEWRTPQLTGVELNSKTYGIVGLGRIGSRVARIAQAFQMNVLAYDPFKEDLYFKNLGIQRVSFEELLKQSDVISFHVPKTKDTFHMLNQSHFEYINPEAIVVNTSRGEVICEEDLCLALEQKKVKCVGLDVFEQEPLARHSHLNKFSQVVLSPHIGAATHDAYHKASNEAVKKLIDFFTTGQVSDSLPPQDNWY